MLNSAKQARLAAQWEGQGRFRVVPGRLLANPAGGLVGSTFLCWLRARLT